MKLLNTHFKHSILVTVLFSTLSAYSLPLELIDEALFFNGGGGQVPPALAVTFDDSGSMAWGYMPDSRSFPEDKMSFASSDYNLIYYNPNIVYTPPVKADGSSFPDANFSNASLDGYYVGVKGNELFSTVDLGSDYRVVESYRPYYNCGDCGDSNGFIASASYTINYANNAGRHDDENPAFYYSWNGASNASLNTMKDSTNYTLNVISSAQERTNFANWYSYYNTRTKLAKAAVSLAFVNFGKNFKIDWQQINNERFDPTDTNMNIFGGLHRADFYDWLFLIPASGGTPLRRATQEAGEIFTVADVYFDGNGNGSDLSCQQNFHIAISDGSWNSAKGTVLTNVDGTNDTLPDGTAYSSNAYPEKMYENPEKLTLADTAFKYWATDLRPALDNNVPTFFDDITDSNGTSIILSSDEDWRVNNELYWNPKNNPANWQHMVNFNVGLGIEGTFNLATDLPGIRNGTLTWPPTDDECFKSNGSIRTCGLQSCKIGNNWSRANCLQAIGSIIDCSEYNYDLLQWESINCPDRIFSRNNVGTNEARVDDVWHASLNSRGDYFSARDPLELSTALNSVVSKIIQRSGRASAASVSSSIISNESLAYKTGYDTSDWSGFVVASQLNQDGSLGAVKWDAACKLTGGECTTMIGNPIVNATITPSTRNIFTYDTSTQVKHPFQISDMSAAEINKILDSNYFRSLIPAVTDLVGAADRVIQYVRGDRAFEQKQGGEFRNRKSLLADVIHSSPNVIRGPSASYQDNIWNPGSPEQLADAADQGYKDFKAANQSRKNVILVGVNDGMLHAFDAGVNSTNGGDELWAYIPSKALDGISELVNPSYRHTSYVDSSPTVRDAYINSSWSTVALGGMRHGGKLFYALDLGSDPEQEPNVLWEFTDDDDSDMGFSYSGGQIGRVTYANASSVIETKWVAFVPNGYNSANQKSVLYAIDLETGLVLHKWNTGIGSIASPNGMGPVTLSDYIDYTNTGIYGSDQGIDFVYAGDLQGNLYRFDSSDIFTGNDTVEILYNGDVTRPITTSPRVYAPEDGSESVVVVFGTGKYLELSDNKVTGVASQHLIGLRDLRLPITNPYSLNDSRLVEHTFTTNTAAGTRTISQEVLNPGDGWKIVLPELGERMVNNLNRNSQQKLLFATSVIPSSSGADLCSLKGGRSWFMVIDALTGSSPIQGKFLRNGTADGQLIDGMVTGSSILTSVGGNQTIINIDTSAGSIASDSDSDTISLVLNSGEKWRRRSWHRIIFN